MIQPDPNSTPAVAVVPREQRVGGVVLSTPAGSLSNFPLTDESPVEPGLNVHGPRMDPDVRVEGRAEKPVGRVDSLQSFPSEPTGGEGSDPNVFDSRIYAARARTRVAESQSNSHPNRGVTQLSASPLEPRTTVPAPPAPSSVHDARATIEAIKKLEERLGTLTVLQTLYSGIAERLVRAERALQRTEDMVADRTFMHLCTRIDEGLIRTEETLRRIDAFIADGTLEQFSQRIDARLADTEDAVHRLERLVEGGSLHTVSAGGNGHMAPGPNEGVRHHETGEARGTTHPRLHDVQAADHGASWSAWVAAMKRVDAPHLARRSAPVLVMLSVMAIVGLGHEPSEREFIPSSELPVPLFVAPDLTAVPLAVPARTRPAASASRAGNPVIRVPSREPAAVSSVQYVGTLRVASEPAGASVFVNGREVGVTPLTLSRQRAGSLALQITREGFQRWTAAIQVPAGRSTQVTATLQPDRP